MRIARSRSLLVPLTAICLASLAIPGVAAAAPAVGTQPSLASLILPDPEPGWSVAPASAVSQVTERLEKIDSNALNGGNVSVAANLWLDTNGSGFLDITLSQLPSNLSNWSQLMQVGFDDECVEVTGNNPTSVTAAAGLPGSLSSLCTAEDGSVQLAAIMARKGDLIEMVESLGVNGSPPVSLPQADSIAVSQYALLPAPPGTNPVQAAVGAVVIGGLIASVVVLVRRLNRRRRGSGVTGFDFALASAPLTGTTAPPWQTRQAPQPASVYVPQAARVAGAMTQSRPAQDTALPTLDDFLSADEPSGQTGRVIESQPVPSPASLAPAVTTTRNVGWHPEGDNSYIQRYWDGTNWVGRVEWNGSEWRVVEVAAVATAPPGAQT